MEGEWKFGYKRGSFRTTWAHEENEEMEYCYETKKAMETAKTIGFASANDRYICSTVYYNTVLMFLFLLSVRYLIDVQCDKHIMIVYL